MFSCRKKANNYFDKYSLYDNKAVYLKILIPEDSEDIDSYQYNWNFETAEFPYEAEKIYVSLFKVNEISYRFSILPNPVEFDRIVQYSENIYLIVPKAEDFGLEELPKQDMRYIHPRMDNKMNYFINKIISSKDSI